MNITTMRDPRLDADRAHKGNHATMTTATTDTVIEERYQHIPIRLLQQGAGYQRPVDKIRVETIAKNFDPSQLKIIDVALLPEGIFEVIDGQHRIEAAKLAGYDRSLLCHVSIGLSYEQRAERFVMLNTGSRKPSELDLFWANVEAGSRVERSILRIVRNSGYDVVRPGHPGGSPRGALQCIGSLNQAYMGEDEFALSRTLTAMHEAGWNGHDIKSTQVRAISAFIIRYRDSYRHTRLVEVLASEMPVRVVAGIKATQNEFSESGNKVGAHQGGTYIYRLYNKGLRTRRLSPWEDTTKLRTRRASGFIEGDDE